MLVTLIPMFDENMVVKAYSLFTQKKNNFLNPMLLGTGYNDGVTQIAGLELLDLMGIETLAQGTEVFVDVNNISIFADLEEQCHAPHERLVLLMDNSVKPEEMYIKRLKELKGKGYKVAEIMTLYAKQGKLAHEVNPTVLNLATLGRNAERTN